MVVTLTAALLGPALPSALADDFTSPATGTRSVVGAILANYRALGGPAGVLGYPTTDELPTRNGIGRYNHFQRGSIYWLPSTGAHEVRGGIRQEWAATGWENGPLGFPVTGELPTRQAGAAYSTFQFGSIYWSAGTGAHAVRGAIRDRWAAAGWENGQLGFPVTGELPTADGRGAYNHFQRGSIYWSAGTGAQIVLGAIRDAWAEMGWENGALGYPTSGEYRYGGGVRQDFQNGSLTWTAAGGTVPEVTIRGSGTTVVSLAKGATPMVAELTYSGPYDNFVVWGLGADYEPQDLLANEVSTSYSAVVPLDFAVWGPQRTRGFEVESSGEWTIRTMPLSAVWSYGKGSRVDGHRSTVWRYSGPAGIAHITGSSSGYFGVKTYDASTGYGDLLANEIGSWSGSVPISGNVYVEVESDGPWSITVD
ncbi:LGFP repeat-containing protein [Blastococcus sp. SYSU DS0539]